mgnify:CR=1 FL=1
MTVKGMLPILILVEIPVVHCVRTSHMLSEDPSFIPVGIGMGRGLRKCSEQSAPVCCSVLS